MIIGSIILLMAIICLFFGFKNPKGKSDNTRHRTVFCHSYHMEQVKKEMQLEDKVLEKATNKTVLDDHVLTEDDVIETVYKIYPEGFAHCLFNNLEEAVEELVNLAKNSDAPGRIICELKEMSRKEFNDLDEFQGY